MLERSKLRRLEEKVRNLQAQLDRTAKQDIIVESPRVEHGVYAVSGGPTPPGFTTRTVVDAIKKINDGD